EREVQHVDVEVDDVEPIRAAPDFVEHGEVCGDIRFERAFVQSDGAIPHHDKVSRGDRVPGPEERHVVSERHQNVRQEGDDALRAAVELRRDRFVEWRYLRDPHSKPNLSTPRYYRRTPVALPSSSPAPSARNRRFPSIHGGGEQHPYQES